MANTNIINAAFGSGLCAVTTSAFRANYGMKLRFSGIELPTAFECDFSNYDTLNNDSITAIGQNNEVQIPDDMWDSGLNIYAYVYLHPTDDSGVTVYTVTIPVLGRPNRTEEEPTPHEQSVIEQAISALNDAVEQTAADVVAADASAQAAAQSEANASVSERSAAASASAALASQNAAESAARSATESASGASESARNAAQSASQAAESATSAQESAEQAEQAVQSITDDVERSERAANTATGKATEAASSAATASTKATQAEQSATAAAQSASSASSAAQNAASSATAAESSATDANTAKTAAQAAQAAAEQAAESVSGLSAQIEQNTADIADLVQSKAGVLVDTATGSIASFVPDATVPTVKGLIVDVEPVQDLQGYDHPWPAGGGKNLFDASTFPTYTRGGVTCTNNGNGSFTLSGTATSDVYFDIFNPQFSPSSGGTELPTNSYRITGCPANGSVQTYYMYIYPSYTCDTGNGGTNQSTTVSGGSIFVKSGYTCNNLVFWPMLRISTNGDDTFAPYSNICPISGWTGANVTRTGKNLFDLRNLRGGSFDSAAVFPTGNICTGEYIPIKGGQSYIWSQSIYSDGSPSGRYVRWYDSSKNMVGDKSIYTVSAKVIQSPANAVYARFMWYQTSYFNSVDEIIAREPQLELGSTATAYEPYAGNTYTIQLGQTVYGGTLDVTNGVLTVDRAFVTFDGDENWYEYNPDNYDSFCFTTNEPNKKIQILTSISNMYKNIEGAWGSGGNGKYAVFSDHVTLARWYFTRPNAAFEKSVTAWKAWLAENPLQVCYELATPITVDLTPLEISVLTGQTNNIWADSGDVSVEYAADLKTYIDQKIAAAVAALS